MILLEKFTLDGKPVSGTTHRFADGHFATLAPLGAKLAGREEPMTWATQPHRTFIPA